MLLGTAQWDDDDEVFRLQDGFRLLPVEMSQKHRASMCFGECRLPLVGRVPFREELGLPISTSEGPAIGASMNDRKAFRARNASQGLRLRRYGLAACRGFLPAEATQKNLFSPGVLRLPVRFGNLPEIQQI